MSHLQTLFLDLSTLATVPCFCSLLQQTPWKSYRYSLSPLPLHNLPIPATLSWHCSGILDASSQSPLHWTSQHSVSVQNSLIHESLCTWSLKHLPLVLLLPQQPFLPRFLCKRNCMNQGSAQHPLLFSKYTSVLDDLILPHLSC